MIKVQTANKVSQQQLTGASGQPITCLRFSGDVSSASKDAIVGTYQALDKASHKTILLDFKGVEYLNSSG
ncbi:MAG TPA: anti-sigma factor antagonist, partial [Edaphobacter sp.]|nr:anti-sigma factor antagonist [Edaphobacter sp.]